MAHRLLRGCIIVALVALIMAWGGGDANRTHLARAAPAFAVNSTDDTIDAAPGDGVCATTTGACTLRAAVMEANALGGTPADPVTITVPAGTYRLSRKPQYIPGTTGAYDNGDDRGDLNLTGAVAITGAGADATIIDGANDAADLAQGAGDRDRVFRVEKGAAARIAAVTIRNGYVTFGTNSNFGGRGGSSGGGISVEQGATLLLTDSVVRDNRANGGGGISSGGTLAVVRSRIVGNMAVSERSNRYNGGGVLTFGTLTVADSTVADNSASDSGGGIAQLEAAGATATITGSTISGNRTPGAGGGLSGRVTLVNSTVAGNTADSGGGISGGGTLTAVTVAFNMARQGAGVAQIAPYAGANLVPVALRGTLLSNPGGADCAGAIVSADYNLSGDASCPLTQPHDVRDVAPRLGPLAMNGGLTATVPLLAGGPAIDAGGTGANGCPTADQRGVARPRGGACDIGAYEAETMPGAGTGAGVPTALLNAPYPFIPRRLGTG